MSDSIDDTGARLAGAAALLESLLACVGLTLVVSYRFFVPIWDVGPGLLALGLLTSAAYLAGRTAVRRRAVDVAAEGTGRMVRVALVVVIVSQPVLLVLWALDLGVSRIMLATELVLLFVAVWAATGRGPVRLRRWATFAFACVAAVPTLMGSARPAGEAAPRADGPFQRYTFSSYHDLSITTYTVIEGDPQDGGALTLLPDGRVLLVTGGGEARALDIADGVDAEPIELDFPLDVDGYRALGRPVSHLYRVLDAVFVGGRLLASYVHWDPEDECYGIRLAESVMEGSSVGSWTTRFESRPCLALPYPRNTSGGRIAVLDSSRILLSVGTFGVEEVDSAGWREESDYGKILVLDTGTWSHDVFTTGHRNPQGLLVVGDTVWSTEHGPQGGDELNLVEAVSDYGWPFVSYGTDYGRKTLELGGDPGDHSGFRAPVFSWTPSVGISNLIRVSGGSFPRWRDDLLIASLSGRGTGYSLFRVRLLEGRVVNVERIPVESRVRDLVQLPGGGPIVLWSGQRQIRVLRRADHVFSACAGCHGTGFAGPGIGPDLEGVVGRPVALYDHYDYSEALRAYGGDWTPERLDRFLADPQREVPGTSMDHEGITDPSVRAEILQYLAEISVNPDGD